MDKTLINNVMRFYGINKKQAIDFIKAHDITILKYMFDSMAKKSFYED